MELREKRWSELEEHPERATSEDIDSIYNNDLIRVIAKYHIKLVETAKQEIARLQNRIEELELKANNS
jgi:hypothetical protein